MSDVTRNYHIWVPITAPFEDHEKPGEVKLYDGDLTYVELRPGTFSRKESLPYGRHTQGLQKDVLRIKNIRAVGTDLVLTLANLRSNTVSVRKTASWLSNMMGPAYCIFILKNFLDTSNEYTNEEYIDHKSKNVVFIPVPQSFSRFVIIDDHIVVSNKDYFAAYNRHNGKLGFTNYVKVSETPARSNKMFHPPLFTSDGFFMSTSFFRPTWELKYFDSPESHMVETDWTIERYRVDSKGDIEPICTLLSMSCHQASEKLKNELTFVWSDELVYPSICRTREPFTILLKSYYDSVTEGDMHVRILQEFQLSKEMNLNYKTAMIEEVKEFPTCLGFHICTERSGNVQMLAIINKECRSVVRWFNLSEMNGYDKHFVTKNKIFIGLAKGMADFMVSGKNKGLTYEVQATDFSGSELKTVYKGEGLNFAVDFERDNLIVIHRNFDEISIIAV